ncbi:putative secreted protein (Por secretion system target) [Chitinophaga niastensis]|uniref:Putative secreted protein (Por secretion system target) n=1 Tax=Chitinophaga niastensis TaxID=536980 RepID=A0A2P8HMG1_CHINA|nr:T9SS type A sorting domain-containing protein [Chitinophaga niastensis]PSL47377.1 putative secreted protein (Por secretion system target) [Chitinophaga niastensis]
MKSIAPKCVYALLLLAGMCFTAKAQIFLNRHVVASSGGSGVVNNIRIQYTVGEVAILPVTDGRTLLTQGFQQPEELPKLPIGADPVKSYILFPNPAVTNTKVQFDLLTNATVTIEVINPAGQTIYNQFLEMGTGKTTVILPVNHFAAGIYTVVLRVNTSVYFEKLIVQ